MYVCMYVCMYVYERVIGDARIGVVLSLKPNVHINQSSDYNRPTPLICTPVNALALTLTLTPALSFILFAPSPLILYFQSTADCLQQTDPRQMVQNIFRTNDTHVLLGSFGNSDPLQISQVTNSPTIWPTAYELLPYQPTEAHSNNLSHEITNALMNQQN